MVVFPWTCSNCFLSTFPVAVVDAGVVAATADVRSLFILMLIHLPIAPHSVSVSHEICFRCRLSY